MKVNIDEAIFNKAIKENKLELARWLIDSNCPIDKSCYIQRLQMDTLDWLKDNLISVPITSLWEVIENTDDSNIISWFIKNGCVIDKNALYSCVKKKNALFYEFIKKNITLDMEIYKVAIISENIEILEYLRKEYIHLLSEEVKDYAMKYKKKLSIKWLVMNDLL